VTLRESVWAALGTVLDPEIDEPITALGFVASCTVSGDGDVSVHLRLPTFFCAPNFSFLMVADAYDAVAAVEGVRTAEVVLDDHHASPEINAGVAAHAGFVRTFPGEADAELEEVRRYFLEKAVVAGQDRVARPLVDGGAGPDQLAGLTLGAVPPSHALDRLRERRAELGLPAGRQPGEPRAGPATPAPRAADPRRPGGQRRHLQEHPRDPVCRRDGQVSQTAGRAISTRNMFCSR
jgi:metal-sulfur cluster biosynthetic enzyme